MFDNDPLNDSTELGALRRSLAGVAMPERPPLEAIETRGHAHRGRRRSAAARALATGTAAAALLALGVVAVLGRGPAHGTTGTAAPVGDPVPTTGAVRTPSYTLISDSSGNVKLTLHPTRLFNPGALQHDLARSGIPAKVTRGRFCTSDPAPSGFRRIVSMKVGPPQTLTFDPSAIPAGAKLSFGVLPVEPRGYQVAVVTLIDEAAFSCSTAVPVNYPGGGDAWAGYLLLR